MATTFIQFFLLVLLTALNGVVSAMPAMDEETHCASHSADTQVSSHEMSVHQTGVSLSSDASANESVSCCLQDCSCPYGACSQSLYFGGSTDFTLTPDYSKKIVFQRVLLPSFITSPHFRPPIIS